MTIIKILRNESGGVLPILNRDLSDGESYNIPYHLWLELSDSSTIEAYVVDGQVVVNNGTIDLGVPEGLKLIKTFQPSDAENIEFDNTSNGFVANNVQDAIEEAKNTAEGKARYCISVGFDGNASVGRYLEYNSNVDSNQSGFIVPRQSILREQSLSVISNSTCTFTIYTWNGTIETSIATISLANSRKTAVTGLNVSLAALTELRVKLTSGSCSRPILFQFFQVV